MPVFEKILRDKFLRMLAFEKFCGIKICCICNSSKKNSPCFL